MNDTEEKLRARIVELERANADLHSRLDELRRVMTAPPVYVPSAFGIDSSVPSRHNTTVPSWDQRWDQLRHVQMPGFAPATTTASGALAEDMGESSGAFSEPGR